MQDQRGVVWAVSWRDICPWLIIFRTFRVAVSPSVLFLATLALLITPLGWWCARLLFITHDVIDAKSVRYDAELAKQVEWHNSWRGYPPYALTADESVPPPPFPRPRLPDPGIDAATEEFRSFEPTNWPTPATPSSLRAPYDDEGWPAVIYRSYFAPFWQLFRLELEITEFAYFLFGGLWTLVVWAFVGGGITRMALVKLGREERIGLRDSLSFVGRKYVSYLAAPLLVLVVLTLFATPMAMVGLIMLWDPGVVIGGVLWIFMLLAGFVLALLLLWLMFGWPLMWPAISGEGTDAFDALSRSYSYIFQRPLHYLFYAVVALLFGLLGWLLVFLFSEAIITLTYWGASWGTNAFTAWDPQSTASDRIHQITDAVQTGNADGALSIGAWLIGVFVGLIRLIAIAFNFSYFWCAMSAIYLLLRRDVDQTEFDEVYLDEEEETPLPPTKRDSAGVPELADQPSDDAGSSGAPSGTTSADGDQASPDQSGGNSES